MVSQLEEFLSYSLQAYSLLEAFRFMHLNAPAGSVSAAMLQWVGGPLSKPTGSVELFEGPVMASVGPDCLVIACGVSYSSFGGCQHHSGRRVTVSLLGINS